MIERRENDVEKDTVDVMVREGDFIGVNVTDTTLDGLVEYEFVRVMVTVVVPDPDSVKVGVSVILAVAVLLISGERDA